MEGEDSNKLRNYLVELVDKYGINGIGVFRMNGSMVVGEPKDSELSSLKKTSTSYNVIRRQLPKLGIGENKSMVIEKKDEFFVLVDNSTSVLILEANSTLASMKGIFTAELFQLSQLMGD